MQSLRIGSTEVFRVEEVTVAYAPTQLFKTLPEGFVEAHRRHWPDWAAEAGSERIRLCFQSFIFRHAGRVILVDTCNGNHKDRPDMPRWHRTDFPYLERLAQAGVRPEDVDLVLCSHLHADHVGWNTRLRDGRWVPTFPNARYVVSTVELDHWQRAHARDPSAPLHHGSWQDSVLPILEAGLLDTVPVDHAWPGALDGVLQLEHAPGHTPGHVHVVLRGDGRELIYAADTLHHPLQITHPQHSLIDGAREQALATRRRLIEHCIDTQAVLMPAHFACAGTIGIEHGAPRFRDHAH